jgi:hypothetical protein
VRCLPRSWDFTYLETKDEIPVGSTNQGPRIFGPTSLRKNSCKISVRLFMAPLRHAEGALKKSANGGRTEVIGVRTKRRE